MGSSLCRFGGGSRCFVGTVRFTYDPAGRVTVQTPPDLREIGITYDANGNRQSITPPSQSAHRFGYTPVDLEEAYTTPSS